MLKLLTIPVTELNYRYIKGTEKLDISDTFHISNPSPISQALQICRKMKAGRLVNVLKQEPKDPGVKQLSLWERQAESPKAEGHVKFGKEIYVEEDGSSLLYNAITHQATVLFNKMVYYMLIKELNDIAKAFKSNEEAIFYIIRKYKLDGVANYEQLRKALYRYNINSRENYQQRSFSEKYA